MFAVESSRKVTYQRGAAQSQSARASACARGPLTRCPLARRQVRSTPTRSAWASLRRAPRWAAPASRALRGVGAGSPRSRVRARVAGELQRGGGLRGAGEADQGQERRAGAGAGQRAQPGLGPGGGRRVVRLVLMPRGEGTPLATAPAAAAAARSSRDGTDLCLPDRSVRTATCSRPTLVAASHGTWPLHHWPPGFEKAFARLPRLLAMPPVVTALPYSHNGLRASIYV
eukprot:COSAG04_NODE_317_length_16987_cov_33.718025_14_plen_229_part_00